jgi:hypothetical protein
VNKVPDIVETVPAELVDVPDKTPVDETIKFKDAIAPVEAYVEPLYVPAFDVTKPPECIVPPPLPPQLAHIDAIVVQTRKARIRLDRFINRRTP